MTDKPATQLRAMLDDLERCNISTPDYIQCPKCEHIFDLKGHSKPVECRVDECQIKPYIEKHQDR